MHFIISGIVYAMILSNHTEGPLYDFLKHWEILLSPQVLFAVLKRNYKDDISFEGNHFDSDPETSQSSLGTGFKNHHNSDAVRCV